MKRASSLAVNASRTLVPVSRPFGAKRTAGWLRVKSFTNEAMGDLDVAETRARLQEQFVKFGGEKYGQGWDDLWNKGDFLPWDRGIPSPALIETLSKRSSVIGNALTGVDGKPQRKKALVPGCGRGVDVCLLESFGYDVIGLEYSGKAVEACEKYAEQHGNDYAVRDEKIGKGSKKFVRGDFYKDDWLDQTGLGVKHFDLIYDYTVGIRALDWVVIV